MSFSYKVFHSVDFDNLSGRIQKYSTFTVMWGMNRQANSHALTLCQLTI